MSNPLPAEKWKERIADISNFYCRKGRMPSYAEVGGLLGIRSKNAVSKIVDRMQKLGAIKRDPQGRLLPLSIARPLRVLGTVEAGFPSPAEEELVDSLSLDDFLVKNRQASFLLKVSGDSMSGAGIIAGDLVIVDRSRTARNGDIVIAEVDGDWTMKYLKKSAGGVVLVPANPNYKPIKPKNELKIAGVVTAVVRKYG